MIPEGAMTTYKLAVLIPQKISVPGFIGKEMDRQSFYEWIWNRFSKSSLLGVHEGTVLSEQAAEEGFESDAWLADSGEAPKDRDWVERQDEIKAELFFSEHSQALSAASLLKQIPEITVGKVEEQEPQDWDAEWKASFLNSEKGLEIPPFWHVIPPWVDVNTNQTKAVQNRFMKINPGAGFGTGTHETTQLCLEAVGRLSEKYSLKGVKALDFGSGSGILSIGMARLGAYVDAVEVDPLAIENARENVKLNDVELRVSFYQTLPKEQKRYHFITANILRPVLLEYAERLVNRLHPTGILILSGLVEKDVELIFNEYSRRLRKPEARVMEKGEWRALVFGG